MKYSLFIAIILFTLSGYSQNKEWQPTTREIVVEYSDSIARARILIKPEKIKMQNDRPYYWHKKGVIRSNFGGYVGELLEGDYFVQDNNKNLLTKGQFSKGLRTGVWKTWNTNGYLLQELEFEEGVLHGNVLTYDGAGSITKIEKYKHGKIDVPPVKEQKVATKSDEEEKVVKKDIAKPGKGKRIMKRKEKNISEDSEKH